MKNYITIFLIVFLFFEQKYFLDSCTCILDYQLTNYMCLDFSAVIFAEVTRTVLRKQSESLNLTI